MMSWWGPCSGSPGTAPATHVGRSLACSTGRRAFTILGYPPSHVHSDIVTLDAPPTSPALHEITEPRRCPIRTPDCRRDTCAHLKPHDSSASHAERWKSTGPTLPGLLIESSVDAWPTRSRICRLGR